MVLELSENSKLFNRITRPIRDCIMPNLRPIQFRGPSEMVTISLNFVFGFPRFRIDLGQTFRDQDSTQNRVELHN